MIAGCRREDRPDHSAARREAEIDTHLADGADVFVTPCTIHGAEDAARFLGGSQHVADPTADIAGQVTDFYAIPRIQLLIGRCGLLVTDSVGGQRRRRDSESGDSCRKGWRKDLVHVQSPSEPLRTSPSQAACAVSVGENDCDRRMIQTRRITVR